MRQQISVSLPCAFTPQQLASQQLPAHVALVYCGSANEMLLAWDALEVVTPTKGDSFNQLKHALQAQADWWFGHLAYDLKNELENLQSQNPDGIGFPNLSFFRPAVVAHIKAQHATLFVASGCTAQANAVANLLQHSAPPLNDAAEVPTIRPRISHAAYLRNVAALKQHIKLGNIYEINFCQEFFAEQATLNPVGVFSRLVERTRAPFSCFLKHSSAFLLCGSPERFLAKQGQRVWSQPIKGTIRRGSSPQEDAELAEQLRSDPKERSENVMIVDLVRNDLSVVAEPGTVQVDELCGIYAFETVHQMISTVSCKLPANVHPVDAVKAAFPMGSMTGAPKIAAMQLAEAHENTKRGLYSGAVGYFTPTGDFDFNVVIRAIQYQQASGYVSMMVGGAITDLATPENEYQECLLKAEALFAALGASLVEA